MASSAFVACGGGSESSSTAPTPAANNDSSAAAPADNSSSAADSGADSSAADDGAEIIFGNGTNPDTKDCMDVTVIAADFVDGIPSAANYQEAAALQQAQVQAVQAVQAVSPAPTAQTFSFQRTEEDKKADAEAMYRAGVKAADKTDIYDDIFNVFKNK
jgi:cell division protein FtsZ